jgi:flagellar hook-associated protein 2
VLTEDVTLNGTDYTAGTPIADIPDGDLPPQQIDADGDGDEDDPNPDYPATESRVTQARAATVGDVIDIINDAAANYDPDGDGVANPLDLTAGINAAGTGLVINDSTGGGGNLIIAEPVDGAGDPRPNRTTARDLGIVTSDTGVAPGSFEGRRLVAGINTVLVSNLNGGSGLTATDLEITDRSGVTTNVTVDAALFGGSLNELVEAVNADLAAAGNAVRLGVNNAGNGLRVTDESGASGNLVVSGGLADELGLAVDAATSTSEGESLQMRWIGEATRLDSLNAGRGIGTGTFRITDASGTSLEYRVTSSLSTVEDLVSFINSRPNNNIEARVNDNGDGILITDTSGGAGQLVIEDEEGSVARNLNLVGEYEVDGVTGEAAADGSFERVIEFNDTDTLDDVVRTFNEAGVGVTASIVNDGAPGTPYRINFTSRDSGSEGRFILDTAGLDLGLSTISEGDDAVVFFGSDDPATAVLLTSSTNTLDDVVRGVSIDLKQASSDPVELTVQRDTGAIEEAMTEFVDAFNGVLDTLDQYDNYNAETERASLLLGDGTIQQIRSQLYRVIQQPAQNVDSRYRFLFEVGVRIGDGARLTFDSGDFREALEQDFESVRNVVAAFELAPREPVEIVPGVTVQPEEDNVRSSGVAELVEALADGFTNSIDGLLTRKDDQLDTQIDLQEDRIGRFDEQLARERARLERQFVAMEQALAQLQTQQQALGQLSG